MTDVANSEARLGSAVRSAGGRSASIFAARAAFLAVILLAWQGAVDSGLANAAFISTPASVARSLWLLFRDGEILPDLGLAADKATYKALDASMSVFGLGVDV